MSYFIEVSPVAQDEFIESFDWYNQQQEGLGDRFAVYVEKRLEEIASNPERYAIKKKDIRETLVKIFPFIIVYRIDMIQNKVFILHIFHAKRRPSFKYK